jgi:hypothetical protein
MATEAEILTKLNALLDDISATLDAVGATKRLTLDRATAADAAIVYLREAGDERFRVGLPAGDRDFVIQHSPDGSPLTYADVLRIDSDTGAISVSGLDINGATVSGQALFAGGSAAAPSMAFTGDPDTGLFSPGAGSIAAVTGGEVRWLADANGRVGVGTGLDTPRRRLHVRLGSAVGGTEDVNTVALIERGDGNALLYIKTPSDRIGGVFFGHESEINAGQIRYDHNSDYMSFWTDSSEQVRITSAGLSVGSSGGDYGINWIGLFRQNQDAATEFGIVNGTSGPSAQVKRRMIGGTGYSFAIETLADNSGAPYFQYDYGTAVENIRWRSGGTEFLRYVSSTGNLGVGTFTPTEKLDVNSDAIRVRGKRQPGSASAAGEAGTICWDDDHIYVCTAPNTWKRAALTTW